MFDKEVLFALLRLCFSSNKSQQDANIVASHLRNDTLPDHYMRALPLLYRKVSKDLFPDILWTKIAGIFKYSFYRNQLLLHRAGLAQEKLARYIDGPFIFLKGLGLAIDTYQDIAERPMHDIDVLVPKFPLEHSQISEQLSSGHLWEFRYDGLYAINYYDEYGTKFDIHRKMSLYALRRETLVLLEQHQVLIHHNHFSYYIPCPEHQFIHVIYHGVFSSDVSESKFWLFDAVTILRNHSLCIEKLSAFANTLNLPSAIRRGIDVLAQLPDELELDKEALMALKARIRKNSWLLRWAILDHKQRGHEQCTESRLMMMRAVVTCYILLPLMLRRDISLTDYYKQRLCLSKGSKFWVLVLIQRSFIRSMNILQGKWVPRQGKRG